jgi:hypothetical protein
MALASLGTLSYGTAPNQVVFDALTRTRVHCRPVPDKARRTVAYSEITLDVDAYLAQQPTDSTLDTWRDILQRPGDKLNFNGRGFGKLNINDPANGSIYDVEGGPWTTSLTWRPLGGGNAAILNWQIVCRIPDTKAYGYAKGILECCYSVDYDIDKDGYTKLTTNISG